MLQRRIILFYFCIFHSAPGLADTAAAAWNCEKTADNKEWSCVTTQPGAPKPTESTQTPIQTARPAAKPDAAATETAASPAPQALPPIAQTPPKIVPKPEGWNCNANAEEATWNCNLTGPDPKGQAKLVGEEPKQLGFLEPAFDIKQEQIFSRLQNALPRDPWLNCTKPWEPEVEMPSQTGLRDAAPVDVHADFSETFDQEISHFWGNVEMSRADQRLQADQANYDSVSQVMDAQGNVQYSEEQLALYGRSAQVQLGADKARLRDAMFIAPSVPIRGMAKNVHRESKSFSRFEDVAYTSCRPGNQDWVVHSSQLKMNRDSGKASVKNAWLEFKGLPVMYLPYMSFPVDNRRLTGFLSPSFGNTKKNGVDVNVPYYWNLAPNYDLLMWARYLENRGPLFGGKFRYLTRITEGEINAEVMPHDSERDDTRWQGSFLNKTRFNDKWGSATELNQVSDSRYYEDLSSPLRVTTSRFIHSYSDLYYRTPGVGFLTRWDYYQDVDPTLSKVAGPYRRLPQMLLNLSKSFESIPLEIGMNNEFVYFEHPERLDIGGRINVKPYVSLPYATAGSFLTPKFSIQNTQYFVNNRMPGLPDSINRTVPIVSLDGGLILERDLGTGASRYRQTLEPRLFYLYIPYVNQDQLPLYDSALYDSNFNQLFFENRFSGTDRIGDANQITAALTTRLLQNNTGTELLNFSIGEIFYFQDRRVVMPTQNLDTGALIPGKRETGSFSNIITQLSGQATDNVSFLTGLQWNPNDGNIDRGNAAIRYNNGSNTIFNAGYRYRRDVINPDLDLIHLTDFSFHLPLFNDWSLIGRWQYSILDNLTLESFAGLEKESCCWRFRLIGRRYLNSINSEPQNALFVQVELKGLTSFGQDMDDFLERSIYGYRNPNR